MLRNAQAENGNSMLLSEVDPWKIAIKKGSSKLFPIKAATAIKHGNNSTTNQNRHTMMKSHMATGNRKHVAAVMVMAWSLLLSWF